MDTTAEAEEKNKGGRPPLYDSDTVDKQTRLAAPMVAYVQSQQPGVPFSEILRQAFESYAYARGYRPDR